MTQQEPAMGVSDEARDLMGQLVSLAAYHDADLAQNIAERLDAALPHMQPAGEAVAWKCEWIEDGEVTWAQFHDASNPMPEKWDCPPDRITAYTTPPQPSAEPQQEADDETPPCSTHPDAPHGFNRTSSHSLHRYVCDCEGWRPPQQEAQGAVARRDPAPHAAAPQPTPSTTLNVTTPPAPVDVRGLHALADKWDAEAAEIRANGQSCNYNSIKARAAELRALLSAQQPSVAHDWNCAIAVNARHGCTCTAQQPSADAGDADEERLLGPWEEHFGRAYIDASCAEGVWTHPDHVFEFIEKRARELHDAAIAAQREAGSA